MGNKGFTLNTIVKPIKIIDFSSSVINYGVILLWQKRLFGMQGFSYSKDFTHKSLQVHALVLDLFSCFRQTYPAKAAHKYNIEQ